MPQDQEGNLSSWAHPGEERQQEPQSWLWLLQWITSNLAHHKMHSFHLQGVQSRSSAKQGAVPGCAFCLFSRQEGAQGCLRLVLPWHRFCPRVWHPHCPQGWLCPPAPAALPMLSPWLWRCSGKDRQTKTWGFGAGEQCVASPAPPKPQGSVPCFPQEQGRAAAPSGHPWPLCQGLSHGTCSSSVHPEPGIYCHSFSS